MQPSPELLARIRSRAAELVGGETTFRTLADAEIARVQALWNQNTDAIGRILRAHLFVEHFMTEYLERTNPQLGSIEKARLSFAQKVALLSLADPGVADALPGIKHLNTIRNKLAHRTDTPVTDSDASSFMSCKLFATQQTRKSQPDGSSKQPIDVLEDFARYTSIVFTYEHSQLTQAMATAMAELLPPQ
jgi:hypothetical protein